MAHQVTEYLAAGMDVHLAKPIDMTELHGALSRVPQQEGLADKAA